MASKEQIEELKELMLSGTANIDELCCAPDYGITIQQYSDPKFYELYIPIEWIKDYVDFGVSDELAQRYRRFVLNMIKDWEKENE